MADDTRHIILPNADQPVAGGGLVIPSLSDVLNLRARKLSDAEKAQLLKFEPAPGALLPDTRPEIVSVASTIVIPTSADVAGLGIKGLGPLSAEVNRHFPRGEDTQAGKLITDPAATQAAMKELRRRTQGR